MNQIHKTLAAAEKINQLYCYTCHTLEDGEACTNISDNKTQPQHELGKKCQPEEFICMVQRYSYTTSTENATSKPRMWSLERKCTEKCEPGCIIIGERTKLYACVSCCETTLCNKGNDAESLTVYLLSNRILVAIFLFDFIKVYLSF